MPTAVDSLVVRAALYQAAALGYGYPTAAQREEVTELATELLDALAGQPPVLLDALRAVVRSWEQVEVAALESDFNRLFSGSVECPPHESAYEPDIFRRQRALADIAGFYRAFGFELGEASRWQADHIGVELEFCSIVLQRQAHAAEHGWDEPHEVCDDALRSFLLDHLGRWHQSLGSLLRETAVTEAYRALAELTCAVVGLELERMGLRPEPLAARPRAAADDDEVPNCGACPSGAPVD